MAASPRGARSKVSCRGWLYPTVQAARGFWERSSRPPSVGLALRPPVSLFTMISEEGVESSAADGGSGAARIAGRVAALGLSGVAAFCISKCALSAGALGRNCHLLPHCRPR